MRSYNSSTKSGDGPHKKRGSISRQTQNSLKNNIPIQKTIEGVLHGVGLIGKKSMN